MINYSQTECGHGHVTYFFKFQDPPSYLWNEWWVFQIITQLTTFCSCLRIKKNYPDWAWLLSSDTLFIFRTCISYLVQSLITESKLPHTTTSGLQRVNKNIYKNIYKWIGRGVNVIKDLQKEETNSSGLLVLYQWLTFPTGHSHVTWPSSWDCGTRNPVISLQQMKSGSVYSVVVRPLDLRSINRSQIPLPSLALPSSNPGQLVHTVVFNISQVTTRWRYGNLTSLIFSFNKCTANLLY